MLRLATLAIVLCATLALIAWFTPIFAGVSLLLLAALYWWMVSDPLLKQHADYLQRSKM